MPFSKQYELERQLYEARRRIQLDYNTNMRLSHKQGLAEGRAESRAEGRAEGMLNGIRVTLEARFGPEAARWFDNVSVPTDLDQLRDLIQRAATAATLDEFRAHLS